MLQNRTTPGTPTRQRAIDRQLAQLPAMDRRALEKLWRDLFDRVPSPALRRETLIPILAYRIQEKAFGGLRESTARKLAEEHAGEPGAVQDAVRPKTGTRYVREYDGKLHEVTVLDFGYEYQGNAYRSLTEIAKVITGAKWSGPAFFGLRRELRKAIVLAVEPFGRDDGATQRRDDAYQNYINNKQFTADEIIKFDTPSDGPAIGVTETFVKNYRQMGQALVTIGACEGSTSAPLFVNAYDRRRTAGPGRRSVLRAVRKSLRSHST